MHDYISTDITKFQCEKHGKLVQELKQRGEGGEKNLIIYNDEIVHSRYRNATIMQIMCLLLEK